MSKANQQTILLVEDTLPVAQLYEECLRQQGYKVVLTENGKQSFEFLDQTMPAAIVLDLMLPDANGMEILQRARQSYPDLPVIVVTAMNSVNVAVEAMHRGAYDYLVKPVSSSRLTTTVRNALERKALVTEISELRQVVGQSQFHDFVGQSSSMQAIYRIIDSVAPSKANVFIRGEYGAGKDLAAQAIHKTSPRRAKPFVTIDCVALPNGPNENNLNEQIRSAQGGSLLFDEICDMPLDMQARLLRFLQTGEIMSAVGNKMEAIDVRVLAATKRDPQAEVRAGGLREDLYYRLNVIQIEMPPLRERDEDIMVLAQHFLARYNAEEGKSFTGFDADVMSLLRRYDWPGNVRQLENVIRNVVVLGSGATVTAAMLPNDLQRFAEKSLWPANQNAEELMLGDSTPRDAIKPLWLAEKEAIQHALDFTNQDMSLAASLLQVSPSTLYRKVQAWREEKLLVASC